MDDRRKLVRCSSYYVRDSVDRMPDGILMSIISHLPFKEAVRTSILARKWRYLWHYSVSDLDFEAPRRLVHYLDYFEDSPISPLKEGRAAYVSWVNRVLELLHPSTTIHRLRLQFFLDSTSAPDIDSWLRFALLKGGLKCLELDFDTPPGLLSYRYHCYPCPDSYPFPNLCDPTQCRLPSLSSFASLETLRLRHVNVSGRVLESFISNSPSLQLLRIEDSNGLTHLQVNGPSISLKHLELLACRQMKKLALIQATNLLSLVYIGPKIDVVLGDIPQFVKLHHGTCETVARGMVPFCSHFAQLEELIVDAVPLVEKARGLERIGSCPMCFPCLKKLVFRVEADDAESVVMMSSSLIDKAPNLYDFRLELRWGRPQGEEPLRLNGQARSPRQSLKTVEIIGFAGGTADVELVMFFLRIGVSLERMVIDPHRSFEETEILRDFLKGNEKRMARERAKELKAKLSPQTTLVIL